MYIFTNLLSNVEINFVLVMYRSNRAILTHDYVISFGLLEVSYQPITQCTWLCTIDVIEQYHYDVAGPN